jgi:hypothetical protein
MGLGLGSGKSLPLLGVRAGRAQSGILHTHTYREYGEKRKLGKNRASKKWVFPKEPFIEPRPFPK